MFLFLVFEFVYNGNSSADVNEFLGLFCPAFGLQFIVCVVLYSFLSNLACEAGKECVTISWLIYIRVLPIKVQRAKYKH